MEKLVEKFLRESDKIDSNDVVVTRASAYKIENIHVKGGFKTEIKKLSLNPYDKELVKECKIIQLDSISELKKFLNANGQCVIDVINTDDGQMLSLQIYDDYIE